MFDYISSLTLSTAPISISECIQIAEFNYDPLKIAYEEQKLHKSKLKKSTRDLFPTASITGEETLGEEREELNLP